MTKALIDRLKIGCFGLDPIDPLRLLLDEVIEALAQPEQKPVAWMTEHEVLRLALEALYGFIPYLPIEHDKPQCDRYDKAVSAIEAKLKEKNT